jgi:two-component system LytT family response regulator
MNTIIIEDDNLSQQTIIRDCKMFGDEINILGVFDSVENAEAFLSTNTTKIHLIFVDVMLPGKSGVDFISDLFIVPYIIVTTAHENYAVKAFELNVVDYLKKPFIYSRFVQAVEKVIKLIKLDEEVGSSETLVLKNKGSIARFLVKDIDYIESYSDYVKIHIKNESFLHLIALKDIIKKLPEDKFIQIHRQFIINISKVTSVDDNKILLKGHETLAIPISRAKRKAFYEKFLQNS